MMKRKAFSLVEIVMVIVVLGIVAMIGTNIIAHMYEGYIRSKVINSLQAKTTHVLDIISKRLSYRVKDSLVTSINGATYLKLSDPTITTNHNILEWVGYDNEGFVGEWAGSSRFAGWNGFADLNNPSAGAGKLITLGSRLDLTKETITALSYGDIQLTNAKPAAVIFQCNFNMEPISYGYEGPTHRNVWSAKMFANNILDITDPASINDYCERYLLVWTAYAIVPDSVTVDPDGNSNFDLLLKYNYQPWENERYASAKSVLLSKNVTTFKFIQLGHTVRIKLCIKDPQLNIGFCKEKAIF